MTDLTQPDRLSVRVTQPTEGTAIVHVDGELDLFTAPLVDGHIGKQLSPPRVRLVLDLTKVTFFGSAGLATLVRAADTAAEQHMQLVLVATSPIVLRPLKVTGMVGLFTIRRTIQDALENGA